MGLTPPYTIAISVLEDKLFVVKNIINTTGYIRYTIIYHNKLIFTTSNKKIYIITENSCRFFDTPIQFDRLRIPFEIGEPPINLSRFNIPWYVEDLMRNLTYIMCQ